MTPLDTILRIDAPPLLAATLCALSCALLGNFLLLRHHALISDAVSHSVLPGLVIAFMVTGSHAPMTMVIGALCAAWLTITATEYVKAHTQLDDHTIIGIVFTTLFALGVFLLQQATLAQVHLDIQHVLFGNLSALIAVDGRLPTAILFLFVSLVIESLFIIFFYKEVTLVIFDRHYAEHIGYDSFFLRLGMTAVLALVLVAGFQAVGAILILALVICPAAAARVVTQHLPKQITMSLLFALLAVLTGYAAAVAFNINAAAMIAIMAGIIQIIAMVTATHHKPV